MFYYPLTSQNLLQQTTLLTSVVFGQLHPFRALKQAIHFFAPLFSSVVFGYLFELRPSLSRAFLPPQLYTNTSLPQIRHSNPFWSCIFTPFIPLGVADFNTPRISWKALPQLQ
jgi:hypothetical protein